MAVGVLVHTTFATIGLSALLAQSATAFTVVKYAGAAYLVYLGIRTVLRREEFVPSRGDEPAGLRAVFLQAVVSDVLNPKVAMFFVAFLPQFVDAGSGSVASQLITLGVVFALVGLVIDGVIAYFSGGLGNWLRQKTGAADVLRWTTGTILVGLGLRLALERR
jgi:threonine/homoserine/homoserine lactone efflux protein